MRRALLLVLAGCVVYGSEPASWLDVPYVPQVKAGCGAAAVAMVVQYWARHNPELKGAANETSRIDDLLPASRRGIRGTALREYLAERGFAAFVFNGEKQDLQHHVDKGRPVIVCLGSPGTRGDLHYAVVIGIDDESIWLNDSARGKLFREPLARFQKSWDVTDHWALLAVPGKPQ